MQDWAARQLDEVYATTGTSRLRRRDCFFLSTGCIGATATIIALRRGHRGTWWMHAYPLVPALGVSVALASAPPFDNDRPEFEAIARQFLATSDSETLNSQRIGRFQVDRVYEMTTSEVYFTDARRGSTNESGGVYSPNHTLRP